MSKVTWNEIENSSQSEVKQRHKLNDRQLEQQIRRHIDGANAKERRDIYQKFYSRRER